MLTEQNFGGHPLPQLISLSIGCYRTWRNDVTISFFIRDHFPGITSLCLHIPWSLRNTALEIARSQRNVQALELSITTLFGPWIDSRSKISTLEIHLRNTTFPAALQSLKLNVVQVSGHLEWSVAPCAQWINDDILPPVTGLGGPDLKSVEISFVQLEGWFGPERESWRRWVKSRNEDWQIE